MKSQSLRLLVTYLVSIIFLYTPLLQAANPGQLSLPPADLEAPKVTHENINNSLQAGSIVHIKATVTDNIGIKSVTLFHRTKGSEEYHRTIMQRMGETDEYSATLGKDDLVEPGIEYFIQAMDIAGNSLLHGYSFSPLTVAVRPLSTPESLAASEIEEEIPATGAEKKEKKINWLWVGLGVIALGAIAASSGGSDSAETPSSTEPSGVSVIVTAPAP